MKIFLKNFIKLIGFLAIVFHFSLASCQPKEQVLLSDPGVVSFTFRNQFAKDVPGTLDVIKGMGITNIEFSNLFGKTAAEMRQLLNERSMVCTSYGVGYHVLLNETEKVAADAITLGAKYVRVAWIPFENGVFTIENAKKAVADFNAAGKVLSEKGLTFCYHNHGYEFSPYEDGTLFDYIVKNTNPEYVSFEMDILWVTHPGANPVALLNKYPDRFRLLHLKDLKKGVVGDFSGGTPKENDVVLGTGQIDIHAVLQASQNTAIEYYYIEDESPDVLVRVPQSMTYLKGIKGIKKQK